jgi:hypothetical protein
MPGNDPQSFADLLKITDGPELSVAMSTTTIRDEYKIIPTFEIQDGRASLNTHGMNIVQCMCSRRATEEPPFAATGKISTFNKGGVSDVFLTGTRMPLCNDLYMPCFPCTEGHEDLLMGTGQGNV